ncbi:hypothetical protein LGR54_07680 [Ancylobacter sp. Lp-2]|uniref:tetratricopeptide repeat protein n=1 Tax=Ancylobacter sp. Lp-2 TaxID=2881339 RepID=UPI001E2F9B5B|nr:hypothetical protein [Ancylobacter sp. Lp-2]MCB4768480.1 hypothetical protein [Ancylobacter sp. Lp-2]
MSQIASGQDASSPPPSSLAAETAAIEALVKERPSPRELGERLLAARRRWPDDLRLQLIEGAWLESEARIDEALAGYRAAQRAHPANPWPGVRLVELLLRQRRNEEARAAFRDTVWAGTAPESTRTGLLSRTAATIAGLPGRRAYLEGLLRQTPDDRFPLLKLAALSFREQDRATTEQLFAQARALGPLTDESRLIELELHLAQARFEEADALASALQARNPDRVEFARRAIQTAIFTRQTQAMVDRLDAALTRWPDDWLLLFRYNRCPLPGEVDRRLFAALTERAEALASNDRWSFQYAIAGLRHGRVAEAIETIRRLAGSEPVGNMAGPLATALTAHPPATWSNARAISHACDDDVQVVTRPDAAATVVLFSSVVGGLGYLPFGLADGLLAQRPVNVVYLRDLNHRSFTAGVRSLGPDQAAMIAGLRRITGDLGVPVVTMGSSIAGVAAIRCAAMMGAGAAISFAGPVNLGMEASDDTPPPPTSASNGTRAALFSSITEADLGIVELIRAAPGTNIHQCFGAGFAPDVDAARLLDGLANVRLHPVADCADHFVIEHVIADGRFLAILDDAMTDLGAAR